MTFERDNTSVAPLRNFVLNDVDGNEPRITRMARMEEQKSVKSVSSVVKNDVIGSEDMQPIN